MNSTCTLLLWRGVCLSHRQPPFYYADRPSALLGLSDPHLALASPIIAYWALSLLFHGLDVSDWQWLSRYRIHESSEVISRNRVSRSTVVRAVLMQQAIQTALGIATFSDEPPLALLDCRAQMEAIAVRLVSAVTYVLGADLGGRVLNSKGSVLVHHIYWWVIPGLQLLFAMFVIDTWQYFLHRLLHINKFLYKHLHSTHHRLYVPYAFGALYNSPLEGFLLDSLGAVIAEHLSAMTVRQAAVLFTISTLKTVDDHCGYRLPFDPLQIIFANNADYHDIHHQVIGMKSNYAQPFFVHWDALLSTRMTREEVERRKKKVPEKTQ